MVGSLGNFCFATRLSFVPLRRRDAQKRDSVSCVRDSAGSRAGAVRQSRDIDSVGACSWPAC